ncbi:integrase, catalytic region, zinc finger, CCHC-type containing protein [Tanacetum coccineum]
MERESLLYVYERVTTLINVIDTNNVRLIKISINTKFLNSLQPEWSKYITLTRQKYNLMDIDYDVLYDNLSQFEPHVQASKAKKDARNHDPLALVVHSNVHSSHSHAIDDYEEDSQGELQGDAQEDKLITAMMLLARTITQRMQRDNRNQAANAGNGLVQQLDENDQIVHRVPQTESNPGKANVQCYNCNVKGHYASDCPRPKVCDAKYFREQMLLAMKDKAGGNLNDEENDFMLDNAYGDDTLQDPSAAVIMIARIQPTDSNADAEPKYDAEAISEVNASQINLIREMLSKGVHEHTNLKKLKIVINTSDDDQIDSNIIFDDPYVKNNGVTNGHDSNAHDQSFDIESLIYNVQKEAENQQIMNNELKRQKALLQKEL